VLVNKRKLVTFIQVMQRMRGGEVKDPVMLNSGHTWYADDNEKHFKRYMYVHENVRVYFFNCKGAIKLTNPRQPSRTKVFSQKEVIPAIVHLFSHGVIPD